VANTTNLVCCAVLGLVAVNYVRIIKDLTTVAISAWGSDEFENGATAPRSPHRDECWSAVGQYDFAGDSEPEALVIGARIAVGQTHTCVYSRVYGAVERVCAR
jgi:hypothetical protein